MSPEPTSATSPEPRPPSDSPTADATPTAGGGAVVTAGGVAGISAASTAPLRALLHEDWVTHGRSWVHPGLHALAVYRIGHWLLTAPAWLRLPLAIVYKAVNSLLIQNLYGVEIGDEAVIGRRVLIGHHQALHIPSFCVIGDDSILRHNVTIGFAKNGEPRDAVPRLGRRVTVGPGAYLLGPITIEDDVTIGPASIVTVNVPAGATVFAAPARVMRRAT